MKRSASLIHHRRPKLLPSHHLSPISDPESTNPSPVFHCSDKTSASSAVPVLETEAQQTRRGPWRVLGSALLSPVHTLDRLVFPNADGAVVARCDKITAANINLHSLCAAADACRDVVAGCLPTCQHGISVFFAR